MKGLLKCGIIYLECNIVDFGNIKHFKASIWSCDLTRYIDR